MNQHDTPAKVASTDGLGPVACATCGEQPYYTKAHIAAAVAAEREQWEHLVRQALEVMQNHRSDHAQSRIAGMVHGLRQRLPEYGPNVGIEPPRSGRLE